MAKEFLARSKGAPIDIRAVVEPLAENGDEFESSGASWERMQVLRSALDQLDRARTLDLKMNRHTFKHWVAPLLDHPTPHLMFLSLSADSRSRISLPQFPEILRMAPGLRQISLRRCAMAWTAPSVQAVTHLRLDSVAPSLHDWTVFCDGLEGLPHLVALDIDDALPTVDKPSLSPVRRLCLPTLLKMRIWDDPLDIHYFLSHISWISSPISNLSIDCTGHPGTPPEMATTIFPIVQAWLCNTGRNIPRCAHIRMLKDSTIIQGWTADSSTQQSCFRLVFPRLPMTQYLSDLPHLWSRWSDGLLTVSLAAEGYDPPPFVCGPLLKAFPHIHSLYVLGPAVASFLEVLEKDGGLRDRDRQLLMPGLRNVFLRHDNATLKQQIDIKQRAYHAFSGRHLKELHHWGLLGDIRSIPGFETVTMDVGETGCYEEHDDWNLDGEFFV